ncbi:MAG: hypothetical protein BMS9Abin29_1057 [Gemmatimonadota bacterium]|nr:MAG: hypothetical protein BMS9Abin29_1057 [Gemmatimonadota bacterium]
MGLDDLGTLAEPLNLSLKILKLLKHLLGWSVGARKTVPLDLGGQLRLVAVRDDQPHTGFARLVCSSAVDVTSGPKREPKCP